LTERIELASLLAGESSEKAIRALAQRVATGAVFVYPTETVYGIGGRADSTAVEQRIRFVKDRRKSSPFIILADTVERFQTLDLVFPPKALLLARKFWPGNITLVMPRGTCVGDVGVRISDHPFVTAFAKWLGSPLFSTSANVSDYPYVNDPDAIFAAFNGKIDFMIDAGKLPDSLPSTVVRVDNNDSVSILREGKIPSDSIMKALTE
jgi:L-threonylcarbamoyladenylate synthase